ncbi:MAG: Wzz/FepE/Etk N-terminal domain-containing protein [Desulfobacterota bacterium]|nr:Wzz/FepE/Etk N-terminal domain-containing protein [Thermodesulfobacteriota bacterium]
MAAKKRSYHTLRDLFLVLFKHKRIVMVTVCAAVVAATMAALIVGPVYEADSKLLVLSPSPDTTENTAVLTQHIDAAVEMLTGRFLIERVLQEVGIEKIYPGIGGKPLFSELTPLQRAYDRFRDSLTVRKGPIITVLFQHRDPVIAAEVVNKLVERFIEQYLSARRQHQKYEFFKEQLELMEKKLKASQEELGLFRNENNISSIQKQKSLLLLQISDMEVELGKTRADISQQEDLAETAGTTPRERDEIQKRLAALRSKEKKLGQQITQYRLALGQLDKAETRLNELERQVKIDEENYLLYAKKTEEARIARAMEEQKLAHFSVIEPALPPIKPVRPNAALVLLVAAFIGLGAGIMLALLREYVTHTFDTVGDVSTVLGCTAPAALPELSPQEQALALRLQQSKDTIEQCMRLSHCLERALPDASTRCVLFTGAADQTGTSWALVALGCVLARQGSRVVLIDANLRAPLLHRLCSCEDAAGLSDAITAGMTVEEVAKRTAVENLMLVPAGALTDNPALLLQNQRCKELLWQARNHADWVLIDTPAVTMYSDASFLSQAVDGAVLVLRAGVTRWEVARSAAGWLEQYNLRLLCALLTRHRKYIPAWLYQRL